MAVRLDSLGQKGIRLSDIPQDVTIPEVKPQGTSGTLTPTWGINPWAGYQKADIPKGTLEDDDSESLSERGLKGLANIVPETARETIGGGGVLGRVVRWKLAGNLAEKLQGVEGAPTRKELSAMIKERTKAGTKIPTFEQKPAETVGEKVTDIAVGITGFMAKLALLKKAFPGTSGAALWEMENLSSGGIPGMGYATYGVFKAPGKIIKGTGKAAKVGRLVSESGGLAGLSALQSKIDTGEVQWKDVAVSGLIPVALRGAGVAKVKMSKLFADAFNSGASQKTVKKVSKAIMQKSKETGLPVDHIVGNIQLRRDAPKIISAFPQKIRDQKSLEQIGKGIQHKLGLDHWDITWVLDPKGTKSSRGLIRFGNTLLDIDSHTSTINITEPTGLRFPATALKAGHGTPQKVKRHTQSMAKETIVHELGHLINPPLRPSTGATRGGDALVRGAHGKEFNKWVNEHVKVLFAEKPGKLVPVSEAGKTPGGKTIQPQVIKGAKPKTGLQIIQEWGEKAQLLNNTERKANVKKLRQQQAARGRARYHLERKAGKSRRESFKLATKSYGGRAAQPEIEPLVMTEGQRDYFDRKIEKVYPESMQFQRTGTADAFEKMQSGRIPTNYEFGLLEPVLGRAANKKLYTQLVKKRPFSGWELPGLAIQFFKMKFGLDIQTFRQGRSLALRHPFIYAKGIGKDTVSRLSNKYAEKTFAAVQNSPGYKHAEKVGYNFVGEAGYSSNRLEYYSLGLTERLLTSKSKGLRVLGRIYESSERGAVAGINTMQKSLYDSGMRQAKRLGYQGKQLDAFMRNRAKTHNTFMKILRVPPDTYKGQYKGLRRLQLAANYLLFSPSMTASRPLSIKALVANKGSRAYTGGILASNIASIFATTSIAAMVGNRMRQQNPTVEPDVNGELNILDGMWGKIRYGDEVFDFSGGDAPFYRTLARIGVSAYMHGKGKIQDKTLTEIAGKRIPDAGDTVTNYIDTRETAAIGYARTMLTGRDWMGEPIPRFEATMRAISPEIIEATIEAGMADGTWAAIATMAGTATSVGVSSYPVNAATTRSKFRDIVANQSYQKDWDMLSSNEQNKMRRDHRQQFDMLSERVRKERIQKPFDAKKIKEAEVASGKRVLRKLSDENKQYAEDISMGLSRTPKNYWLNDDRFNQYENLVSEFVDEKMSKVDFSNMEERRRIDRVQVIVKAAKNKAFSTLRRETR